MYVAVVCPRFGLNHHYTLSMERKYAQCLPPTSLSPHARRHCLHVSQCVCVCVCVWFVPTPATGGAGAIVDDDDAGDYEEDEETRAQRLLGAKVRSALVDAICVFVACLLTLYTTLPCIHHASGGV